MNQIKSIIQATAFGALLGIVLPVTNLIADPLAIDGDQIYGVDEDGNRAYKRIPRKKVFQTAGSLAASTSTTRAVQERAITKVNSGLFLPYINYPVGSWPEAVAIADLNDDGRNDVVMTTSFDNNQFNDLRVYIYFQDEWGRFGLPETLLTTGTPLERPRGLDIGDLNNDNRPDIVVGNQDKNLEIFYQGTDGRYTTSIVYNHQDTMKIRIADLNNDGLDDIVGINWGGAAATVWLQNISGTLDAPVSYSAPHSGGDIEVGDINNDGLTDIVVMSESTLTYDALAILLQNNQGGFDGPFHYDIGGDELKYGVTIGDMNSDGRNDVIVVYGLNEATSKIAIFDQNLNGTLDSPVLYDTAGTPKSIESADLNQDGRDDIAVFHPGNLALGVYLQEQNGNILPEEIYPLPFTSAIANPHGLALGDVDNDGKNDVVIADHTFGLIVLHTSQLRKTDYCAIGETVDFMFQDDLENSESGNWVTGFGTSINHWTGCAGSPDVYCPDKPNTGAMSFYGYGYDLADESWVEMANSFTIPKNAFFEFESIFDLESGFDGGVIEYSFNGGYTWLDAGALIENGLDYTASLSSSYGNPLGGRNAFTGNSGSLYGSTRLNLAPLKDKGVKFRFRMGTDNTNASPGWFIDDVVLYTCTANIKKSDVVIDFGVIGLWSFMSDGLWQKLNNSSPDDVITGDVDGNGIDDVIADFSSTFGGIFIKRNGGAWAKLHNSGPQSMATGDLDGNGSDDIVIDFGGVGLWAHMNDSTWLKLNNTSPDQFVITDMDGNGAEDIIADFSTTFGGIFVKRNQGAWSKLHNTSPVTMGTGDLDGNGSGDVIINFGGIGLWARMNNASWLKLHNGSPDSVIAGDVDGNGADDVVASFGSTIGGVWQKQNLGGWTKLNNSAPDQMVMGDMDGNGQSDLIGAFNSTLGGIFVRRNNGSWQKLHNNNPDALAVGNLDGN